MLLSLALAVVPSVVWASAADPTVATDFAAGSTGRADPRSLSAVITSPGVLALERQYTLGGSARFGPRQGRAYHAGASDSVTGPIALGVLWAGQRETTPTSGADVPGWRLPEEDRTNPTESMRIGGALAGAVAQRRVGLGAGVVYHRHGSRYQDALGMVDLTLGVSGKLGDQVVVAAAVRDFLPSTRYAHAPLNIDGGFRWLPSSWMGFEVDVFADLESSEQPELGVGAGGVVFLAETVPIRAGFTHDPLRGGDSISAGVGGGSDRGTIEYAFRLPLQPIEPNSGSLGTWHGVSLLTYF